MKNKNSYLLGGSFNPPTIAHLEIIKYLTQLGKVIIVPNGNHYTNKELIPFQNRVEMLEIMFREGEIMKDITISDIEGLRPFQGSIQTLRDLNHPIMVIGDDCLESLDTWIEYQTLVGENDFLVITRKMNEQMIKEYLEGHCFLKQYINHFDILDSKKIDNNLPNISSTTIRENNKHEYLTENVFNYIKKNKLYGV